MVSKITSISRPETSVLIVDDSSQYAGVLRRILTGVFGYTDVTAVESTSAALEMLRREPERFRLMFVDYNFPEGESGGELLRRLKEDNLMEERIAFLITSDPTIENMKEALAAGALGVVAKPFDRHELKNKLDKAEQAVIASNTETF